MKCVVDSSVWVSVASNTEPFHEQSVKFLRTIETEHIAIMCPRLTLLESMAAITRQRPDNTIAAQSLVELIQKFPRLKVIELTRRVMIESMQVAMTSRLRAGDAIHVAVAKIYQARLVTLDDQMIERCGMDLNVMRPADWSMRTRM